MLGILTKTSCPIGVDLSYDSLKMAQLATSGEEMTVVSYGSSSCPSYDLPGGPQWQRWAIDAIRYTRANGQFRGKEIVVALPATDIFVDHLKCPKPSEGKLEDAVFSKIRHNVPSGWTRNSTAIGCLPTEQDTILVIAAQRAIIDRHLAIYERARLKVKSMAVWPLAMAACYARIFARGAGDFHSIVMLLDIQSDCSNVVVCRGGNPLLAYSIPIGVRQFRDTTEADRLAWELTACK